MPASVDDERTCIFLGILAEGATTAAEIGRKNPLFGRAWFQNSCPRLVAKGFVEKISEQRSAKSRYVYRYRITKPGLAEHIRLRAPALSLK